MTNKNYTEKIISQVDRILVDSSTLMNDGIHQFIFNNKELFISTGKKITVTKDVCAELCRHIGSGCYTKSNLAENAMNLIYANDDIFIIDNENVTEDDIAHTFADSKLLCDLISHRSNSKQLLLTNDQKLGCDAHNLNYQQSCRGQKVFVCYIDQSGEMQCCECARVVNDHSLESENTKEEKTDSTTKSDNNAIKAPAKQSWEFDAPSYTIGIASGVAGMIFLRVLYKGAMALLNKK